MSEPTRLPEVRSWFRVETLVELAAELIRIPSVNPKDADDCRRVGITPGERALAEKMADRVRNLGLPVHLQEVMSGRFNLIARFPGEGKGRSLALNSHMDTVGGFDMGKQAFEPRLDKGRLYGRGAADAKGALACFLAVLEAFTRNQVRLKGDLVLTAVIGEEGPPEGTAFLLRSGFRSDGAIVGEPSGLAILTGQRGGQFVRLIAHGRSAHGAIPRQGINAIEQMARLIASFPSMPLFHMTSEPYGTATYTTGTIRGGVRTNVVPDRCECTVDVRMPPGIGPQQVLGAFANQIKALAIEGCVEAEEKGHPACLTPNGDPLVGAARQAASSLGLSDCLGLAPYWSDLAFLIGGGIPAIIMGPGDILQAHSAEEYVDVDQLLLGACLYAACALIYCGEAS